MTSTASGVLAQPAEVRAAWTFRSDTTPSAEPEPLPLWALRFQPVSEEQPEAGTTHTLQLLAETQRGADTRQLTAVTLETSPDDGATWQSAPIRPARTNQYIAQITVPDGATTVSLRARATDSLGNTVEETILGAYPVR